jgi:hypothetical protein
MRDDFQSHWGGDLPRFSLEIIMKQQTNNPTSPSAQDLLNEADAKHWLDLIGRLNDPVVARIFVNVLNDSPLLRARFAGAYLSACETVKRDRIRYAKGKAWGQFTRRTVVAMSRLIQWVWRQVKDGASAGQTRPAQPAACSTERSSEPRLDTMSASQHSLVWPSLGSTTLQ